LVAGLQNQKETTTMICVICKNGETEPGTTTSTLERDSTIILVRGIPAKVCNNCGEAYIDSQTLVRLHNMSPEDSERDEDVDVIVLKYAGSREVGQAMGPVREQRTMDFISRIARDIEPEPRQNGYDLQKPGSTRIGFVRFNIGGKDRGKYRVYAYEPFADPQGRFENDHASPRRGWTCVVDPSDESKIRYVVAVLESSYDQK
jgi:YgiT-type zinc finger domain-containing protein